MDVEKATNELKVIRQLMERPVRYSTMSGLSGILAGAAALAGLLLDCKISADCHQDPIRATWLNMVVWSGVFLTAAAAAIILTRLRERKQNMPFWSPVKRRILMTVLPAFAAGVGLTLAIVYNWAASATPNQWGLIPSIWMLFYGVACWQVGEFAHREIRVLGAAFIVTGRLAAVRWQFEPYWAIGLTFGGYHMAYGAVVWLRHGG